MVLKVKSVLEEEITELQRNVVNSKDPSLDNLYSKLQAIINDIHLLSKLDLNSLKVLEMEATTLKKLEYYQVALELKYFPLSEEALLDAKRIVEELINKVNDLLIKQNASLEEMEKQIDFLKNILTKVLKIDREGYLETKEVICLFNLLNKKINDSKEVIELVNYLCSSSIKNVSKENVRLDNDTLVVEVSDISEESLQVILEEYGYDFNKFSNDNKLVLKTYGNIDNIRDILNIMKEEGIKIDLDIPDMVMKFTMVLVHSNKDIVRVIINNIKEDRIGSEDLSVNEIFNKYLCYPSLFIKRKRIYERKEEISKNITNTGVSGAFDNYIENREYLASLGVDIEKAMMMAAKVFTLPNEKIRANVKNFDNYKIPSSVYLSTLSCMYASDPLAVIDQFIEVGFYEYVLENFSKVILKPDDPMFYRIIKAKQEGKIFYRFYNKGGVEKMCFTREITAYNGSGYGITATNKSRVLKEYFPPYPKEFDSLISNDVFDGNLLMAMDNYFIKKLDQQFKYDDLRYDFNGIIISRYKVLRYYELLIRRSQGDRINSLMYAICKNSILTEEQFRQIEECVRGLFQNRGVAR